MGGIKVTIMSNRGEIPLRTSGKICSAYLRIVPRFIQPLLSIIRWGLREMYQIGSMARKYILSINNLQINIQFGKVLKTIFLSQVAWDSGE